MSQLIETRTGNHLPTYTLQTCIDREQMAGKKKPLGQAQAGIWIHNRRNGRVAHGHYVGRPSVLGNPAELEPGLSRQDVITAYLPWLRREWVKKAGVYQVLYHLARVYTQTGRLDLVCWCAPKACHAEVIRDAILGIVKRAAGVTP